MEWNLWSGEWKVEVVIWGERREIKQVVSLLLRKWREEKHETRNTPTNRALRTELSLRPHSKYEPFRGGEKWREES